MKNDRIEITGCSRMITASAGAGKTYALANGVLSVLAENPNLELSEILLITFTNKAAEEMEKAVYRKIVAQVENAKSPDKNRWKKLLVEFNKNSIQTFDSFFAKILRNFGASGGLDPNYTVMIAHQKEQLLSGIKKEIRKKLVEVIQTKNEWLSRSNTDWLNLLDAFGGAAPLIDFAIDLSRPEEKHLKFMEFVESEFKKDPEEIWTFFRDDIFDPWLRNKMKADQKFLSDHKSDINEFCRSNFSGISQINAQNILRQIKLLADNNGLDHRKLLEVFLSDNFRKPTGKGTPEGFASLMEAIMEIRKKYYTPKADRNFFRQIIDPLPPRDWSFLVNVIQTLNALVSVVSEQLFLKKQKSASLEFDDVRKWCYDLVLNQKRTDGDILKIINDKYKYVFIDEFQDSAPSQLEIMMSIFDFGNIPVFLVGDEKQSIYRFRGAEIRLTRKMQTFLKEKAGKRFKLDELGYNFRSFPDMIEYFNSLFKYVFESPLFQEEYFARYQEQKFPEKEIRKNLISSDDPWEKAKLDRSVKGIKEEILSSVAFYSYANSRDIIPQIVKTVREILASETAKKFIDDKMDYPLIGILLPTTSIFSDLESALDYHKIQYTMFTKGFYQTSEVFAIQNLLNFFVDPENIYNLVALLKSDLIGLPNEQINIFIKELGSSNSIFEKWEQIFPEIFARVQSWLYWHHHLPLKEVIWKVIDHSSLKVKINQEDHAREKAANLAKFIRELPDVPLAEMCRIISAVSIDEKVEKEFVASEDPVTIMTIHKSKGLKFQHVITVTPLEGRKSGPGNYWSQVSYGKNRKATYFTAPKIYHPGDQTRKSDNVINYFSRLKENEELIEEKKRMVYVAHTRAVQSVVIFNKIPAKKYQPGSGNRYFPPNAVLWKFFERISDIRKFQEDLGIENPDFLKIEEIQPGQFRAMVKDISSFDLPVNEIIWPQNSLPDSIRLKLNASKIAEYIHDPMTIVKDLPVSKDMRNNAAVFGTEFHKYMERNINNILTNRHNLLSPADPGTKAHLNTLMGPLQKLFAESIVYTEIDLNYLYSIKFNNVEYDINIVGVADLIILTPDNKYILLDYKTGRIDLEKHAMQLAIYAFILAKNDDLQIDHAALAYSDPENIGDAIQFVDEVPQYIEFDFKEALTGILSKIHPHLMKIV